MAIPTPSSATSIPWLFPRPLSRVIASIITMSCARKSDIAIRPNSRLVAPFWSSSFITTTVLLNVTVAAKKSAPIGSKPINFASANPVIEVSRICRPPKIIAACPRSFIFLKLSSSPTRKSNRPIPSSEISSREWLSSTTRKQGPKKIPAII